MSEQGNNGKHWQEAIAPPLLARLQRPIGQPGIIDSRGMARSIAGRIQRMTNSLPLLAQLEQRWSKISELPAGQTPVVYAQPRPPQTEQIAPVKAPVSVQRPVVQAKLAPRKSPSGIMKHAAPLPASSQDSSTLHIQRKLAPGMANSTPGVSKAPSSVTSTPQNTTGRQTTTFPVVTSNPAQETLTSTSVSGAPSSLINTTENTTGRQTTTFPVVTSNPAQDNRTTMGFSLPSVTLTPAPLKGDRPLVVRAKLTSQGGSGGADPVKILPGNMGQSTVNWTGVGMTPLVLPVPASAREPKAEQSGRVNRALASRQQKQSETTISRVVMPADTQAPTGDRALGKRPETTGMDNIDLEALTNKVERKLVRRLRVEKERRGQGGWR